MYQYGLQKSTSTQVQVSSSSYIATDSQSASSYSCRAPFGAHDQILIIFFVSVLVIYFVQVS
jgi:hypothetical protein